MMNWDLQEKGIALMPEGIRLGRQFSKSMTTAIRTAVMESLDIVIREINETRELYTLLQKWGAGTVLTDEEKRAVKEQLIDICKAIPALAIFMLPFGSLVLVFLIKTLPFNILPSSFNSTSEESSLNELTD